MGSLGLRLGAAAVMTLCCFLIGRALADAQSRRVQALGEWREALERLHLTMLEHLTPLTQALLASSCASMRAVGERMQAERCSPDAAWQDVRAQWRARGQALDCLEGSDFQALDRLFEGLGETGRSSQQRLLDQTTEELSLLQQAARQKLKEQGKLYGSLGALAGLALSIGLL